MGIDISGNYKIENFKISSDSLSFKVKGIQYSFSLSEISIKLAEASDAERDDYRFSASGYGIHWDSINEDLSLQALINSR